MPLCAASEAVDAAMKPTPTASPISSPPPRLSIPSPCIRNAITTHVKSAAKKLTTKGIGGVGSSSAVLPIAAIQGLPKSGPYHSPPRAKAATVATRIAHQLSAAR